MLAQLEKNSLSFTLKLKKWVRYFSTFCIANSCSNIETIFFLIHLWKTYPNIWEINLITKLVCYFYYSYFFIKGQYWKYILKSVFSPFLLQTSWSPELPSIPSSSRLTLSQPESSSSSTLLPDYDNYFYIWT